MTLLLLAILAQPALETCDMTGHCQTWAVANCGTIAPQINEGTTTRARCTRVWIFADTP